jgi:hypothetical protein
LKYLIRLYPRAWRDRYGEEFATLVESQAVRPGLVLDILAGAIDAHLAPQWRRGLDEAAASTPGDTLMKRLALRCADTPYGSRAEQLRYALLTIVSAAAVSGFYLWANRTAKDDPFVEALGISAFPIAVMVGTMPAYLRDHSPAARIIVCTVMLILVYLASLLAVWM